MRHVLVTFLLLGSAALTSTSASAQTRPPPPESWTCKPEWFAANDGCDCGCNALDPDCGPTPTIDACRPENRGFNQCDVRWDRANNSYTLTGEFAVPKRADISVCQPGTCGDGWLDNRPESSGQPHEGCDDGNTNVNDGCDASCRVELSTNITVPAEWTCDATMFNSRATVGSGSCDCGCGARDPDCGGAVDFSVCQTVNCGDGRIPQPGDNALCVASTCGDGIVDRRTERCDDGNRGGCTANCSDFINQNANPCGNGRLEPQLGELCDDANTDNGDGCDQFCKPESQGRCGDGVVDPTRERCDDFNTIFGDGCSEACTLEPGFECPRDGGPCRFVGSAACNNLGANDGCDCGCGRPDADCPNTTAGVCRTVSCPEGPVLDPTDNSKCTRPVNDWRCNPAAYDDGNDCDCGCGSIDPDCADATAASCDVNRCGGTTAPEDTNNALCAIDAGAGEGEGEGEQPPRGEGEGEQGPGPVDDGGDNTDNDNVDTDVSAGDINISCANARTTAMPLSSLLMAAGLGAVLARRRRR